MKKIITFLTLSFFLLNSCGQPQIVEQKVEKTDFILDTQKFSSLGNSYSLEKSSKIEASSEIILNTEASGKVESISIKEGDKVSKGQGLVFMSDNSLTLNTAYKQSILNLEQARIAYKNSKLSLDKNVEDAETNIQKLRVNFENTKKTLEQDLRQAKDNLDNSDLNNANSKSSLDIEKINNSIEKMEFEYKTQQKSNQDKIDSFILSLNKEKDTLRNQIVNAVDLGDNLFNIKNPNVKPKFYDYIGASDSRKRDNAEFAIKKLMDFDKDVLEKSTLKKQEEIDKFIKNLDEGYNTLKEFLDNVLDALNASLSGLTGFPETERTAYTGRVNGYISAYQGNYTGFVTLKTSITSFLNTYKDTEESTLKQIDLAKKDLDITKKAINSGGVSSQTTYEKVRISTADTISNLEIQLKSAESTLENLKKTRDVTLENAMNTIKNAELSVEKSSNEVSKLVVTSPIIGQVAEVYVTVGQTYSPGSKAIKILSTNKSELDVYVTSDDLGRINIGDKVHIEYRGEKYEGEVFSKSNLANETLNYKVKVSLNKNINLVGGVANVSFSVKAKYPLFDINAVKVLHSEDNKKLGTVNIFKDGKIETTQVELGDVYGKFIEIKTQLSADTELILNDVSTYEAEKYNLKAQDISIKNTGSGIVEQKTSTGSTEKIENQKQTSTGKVEATGTGKTVEQQNISPEVNIEKKGK
ncbi:HlyD family efflux transporter periplasmic adaptor subunit [Candidatus Gracilibacteria bacterium]|nr:MAG: HlyD family efflux transporter periplasmic adaptor subunit [Candidatus Gracilibacteria bacterium]